jgi:DNA invertase Pin-like site-specific DNA recombinase
LIEIITTLKNRNVSFVSITEGMDTTTASGELFFHIFGALAQFERSLIQERVNAGLKAAKKRGKTGGRPRAIDDEKLDAIKKAIEDGMSKAAACRTFNVKRSTLIDSLNRLK